ncbi:ribose-5-phosphate isomerase [Mangrovihabitans endophyticus]|uniref:Ribose-5-phosphate isomerase B n=1 Tax=Mangrovihabitans endophyticus TaxID=1751298 RepID=A0A8J3C8M0_9ACTN|nr:ribose-5-phosphate isomerase [Mangrovihabitans endophyticus]GGL20149.1 ribose-5-phosphate isomerase [Mangrovihabitans endophyticus]
MRVYLGSDHAGYELKNHIAEHLAKQGHDVLDVGPHVYDPEDDYPAFCLNAGARVVADPGSLGIVIGGSGNGEQIAANKVAGVRSALAWSAETARLAREHNDANVLAIGARQHTAEVATTFAETFLATPFSGNPRHARRIAQLADYESTRELPPLPAS